MPPSPPAPHLPSSSHPLPLPCLRVPSSLPNLEELNLRKCQITDAGVTELARGLIVKRNIRKLSIGWVGRASVCMCIHTCVCVCVYACHVTIPLVLTPAPLQMLGLVHKTTLPSLTHPSPPPPPPFSFHIRDNRFGSTGLTELIRALAYNPVLEELEVTKLKNSATVEVSDALAFLFRLTVSLKKVSETILAHGNEEK